MRKFKLTLFSLLEVEHYNYNMIDAIKYVEMHYNTEVVKAELVY